MLQRGLVLVSVALSATVTLGACSKEAPSYENLPALREAVASAGVDCETIEQRAKADLVTEAGSCVGSGVNLFLFESQEDLDDWAKVGTRLGPAVIGPNWAVIGESEQIERIAGELGGEVTNPDD